MAFLDFLGRPSQRQLPELDPVEISTRGINLRTDDAFPRILRGRREFDEQFLGADLRQVQSAFTRDGGLRDILEGDIIPSIRRQRGELLTSDVAQFREAAPTFAGAEGIATELQGQTAEDLLLGGQLSPEEIRATEQAISSATGRRGRGAGAFAVGQQALGRESARNRRRRIRRDAATRAAQLGLQVAQPIRNIQAQNAQLIGSPLQQLSFNEAFARRSTPQFDVLDPIVSGLAQTRFGAEFSQAASQNQARRNFGGELLGSVLGAGTKIFSSFLSNPNVEEGSGGRGGGARRISSPLQSNFSSGGDQFGFGAETFASDQFGDAFSDPFIEQLNFSGTGGGFNDPSFTSFDFDLDIADLGSVT